MAKAIFVKRGFHQFQPSKPQQTPWKRVVVLVVVVLLVIGLMPFHSSRLERSLQERFQKSFGAAASFSSVSIRLLRGATLKDFTLYTDSSNQKVVAYCPRVTMKYNPLLYPLTGSYGVYLKEPRVVLEPGEEGRWQLPPSLSNVISDATDEPSSIPAYIRIDKASLEFLRTDRPSLKGEKIDVALTRVRKRGAKPLEMRGIFSLGDEPVSANVHGELDVESSKVEFSGTIKPVTEEFIVLNWLKASFKSTEVRFDGDVAKKGNSFVANLTLEPQESFLNLDDKLAPSLKEASAKLRYDKSVDKLTVQEAMLTLDNYHAMGRGQFGLSGYKPFRFTFASRDMPSETLRVLIDMHFPQRSFDLVTGILGFEIETSGLLDSLAGTVYQGRFDSQGCTFEHVPTGFRITDVSGGLTFSPEKATFENLEAKYTDKRLLLDGSITGEPYVWENPSMDFVAKGEIDLGETGRLAHEFAPRLLENVQIGGNAKVDLKILGPAARPDEAKITGSLQFENANFSGGIFPVPLSRVQGNIALKEDEMQFENLQGSTGRTSLQLQGSWKRGETSWPEGSVDLKMKGTAEATEILPMISRVHPKHLAEYTIQGPLDFDLAVSGPMGSATQQTWEGTALLKQGTIKGGAFGEPLNDVTAEVQLKASEISAVSLKWKRANIPGKFSFEAKSGKKSLSLRADVQLEEARQFAQLHFSRDTKAWKVSGGVFIDLEMHWPTDLSSDPSVKGRVDFQGCVIQHEKWPLPIENFEGLVKIDNSDFLSDRLTFNSGNAHAMVKASYKKGTFTLESLESCELGKVLEKLQQLYPQRFAGWTAGGSMGFTLESSPPDLKDSTMAVRRFEGDVSLYDAFLKTDRMDQPIERIRGTIHYTKSSAESKDLAFALSGSEGTCSFALTDFEAPSVSAEIFSTSLDGNSLLQMLKFRSSTDSQNRPAGVNLQSVESRIRADKFSFLKLDGTEFRTDFSWDTRPGVTSLSLSDTQFNSCAGLVKGRFDTVLREGELVYSGSVEATNLSMREFLATVGSSKEGDVDGTFDLQAMYQGTGLTLDTLEARGDFEARNVVSQQNNMFGRLAETVKLDLFRQISFEKVLSPFVITEQRIFTEDLRWLGKLSEMQWNGSVGFDKTLNYDIKAAVSASGMPGASVTEGTPAGPLFKFLTAKVLDLSLTGTLDEPKYSPKPLRTLIRPAKNVGQIVIKPVKSVVRSLQRSRQPKSASPEQ